MSPADTANHQPGTEVLLEHKAQGRAAEIHWASLGPKAMGDDTNTFKSLDIRVASYAVKQTAVSPCFVFRFYSKTRGCSALDGRIQRPTGNVFPKSILPTA